MRPLQPTLPLEEIQSRVCDIVAKQLGFRRSEVHPRLRLIQDLHCDSLKAVELLMAIEESFAISLPDPGNADPVYKAIFTRADFSLADLAELVYVRQDTCPRSRELWRKETPPPSPEVPFTQLGGSLADDPASPLLQPLENGTPQRFRRSTDGMICILVPAADNVAIGTSANTPFPDEHPAHCISISAFLIDREPVSTTAYARFLNCIEPPAQETLCDWFLLQPTDRRRPHELLHHTATGWRPRPGTERFPMMLVSWFGANAYARWANRLDWRDYRHDAPTLPSEAQWEYAARGAEPHPYPWGAKAPTPDLARFARFSPGDTYHPHTLPLANVNEPLGLSPFGLHHMAGNVWQWCRDSYDPAFYHSPAARAPDPVNTADTGIRAERGGSWIGPAFLCRSSYRRGRAPAAKGRCLGFRCTSALPAP
jgi:acyl carrier protein